MKSQSTLAKAVACLILLFPLSLFAQNFSQVSKNVASDRDPDDQYGYSVAISGDYAIVAAPEDDFNAVGTDSLFAAGAVYMLERDTAGNWVEVQKLTPSDRQNSDRFGRAVAISGSYALVAADMHDYDLGGGNFEENAGAVYFFERDNAGVWQEVAKVVASDRVEYGAFGTSVSISGDYAIVGAAGNECNGVIQKVYFIERDEQGVWQEVQILVDPSTVNFDYFGIGVAISGNYAAVGAHGQDRDEQEANFVNSAGAAYLVERSNQGVWSIVQKIVAPDRRPIDYFGQALALSDNYLIVGARAQDLDAVGADSIADAGAVYFYERDNAGTWQYKNKVVSDGRDLNDQYGMSVSISGDYAIVGSHFEDEDASGSSSLNAAGAAYLIQRNAGGQWAQAQKMVASDRGLNDYFGWSVGISGSYCVVGAYSEDHNVNGGGMMFNAGSAYFFEGPALVSVEEAVPASPLQVYPNPASGRLWVKVEGLAIAQLRLVNLQGRSLELAQHADGSLDISGLAAGLYILQVETAEGCYHSRVVVQ